MADDDIRSDRDRPLPPSQVRQTGTSAGTAEAQQIIDQNRDAAGSFIHAQRQAVRTSTLDIHKATFSSPDLDITYRNHFGEETIEYTAYPQPVPVEPEVSFQPPAIPEPPTFTPVFPPVKLTSKYLLVLYKTNKLAAFSMDAISAKSLAPYYLAESKGSDWSSNRGMVLQLSFGSGGAILSPYNFKPKSAVPTNFVLSTTALLDAIETEADLAQTATPIMNMDDKGTIAWTCGGEYSYQRQGDGSFKFNLSTPIMKGASDMFFYAIDNDGTCYYAPTWSGSPGVFLGTEFTFSSHNYFISPRLTDLLYTFITAARHTAVAYGGYSVETDQSVVTDKNTTQGDITTNMQTQVISGLTDNFAVPLGDVDASTVTGEVYSCRGAFGQLPTFDGDPHVAYSAAYYTTYDPASNSSKAVAGTASDTSYSGQFPTPVWSLKGLAIVKEDVTGTSVSTSTVTPVEPVKYFAYAGISQEASYSAYANGFFDPSQRTDFNIFGYMPPGAAKVDADAYIYLQTSQTSDLAANYHAALLAAGMAVTGAIAGSHYSSTTITVTVTVTNNTRTGVNNITSSGSGGDGVPPKVGGIIADYGGGDQPQVFLYADTHTPYQTSPDIITTHLSGSLNGFGATLTATNTTTDGLAYHPFPPALDPQLKPTGCFYTLHQDNQYKVVTPYKTFDPSPNQDDFKPWLHVSNDTHYIQGWAVVDEPFAYLDGEEMLTTLAKSLDCDKTDIKAMFMDIDLPTILGINNVIADVPDPPEEHAI